MAIENNKAYFYAPAYTGNFHVITLINGKIESRDIISNYDLCGYISCLEKMGYKSGFYVDYFKKKYDEALNEFNSAKEDLLYAEKNPLWINDEAKPVLNDILGC